MISIISSILLTISALAAPVDLLALRPTQTHGSVERTGSGTTLSAGWLSVAAIYHKLDYSRKSFTMKATFSRNRGSDGIGFVIPVGAQNVALVLGGWGGRYDGLNRVNGLDPSNSANPSSRRSKVVNGEDLELEIQVQPKLLRVLVNGKAHIELDPSKVELSVLDDIKKRFDGGLGLYIVNGDLDVLSWTIE